MPVQTRKQTIHGVEITQTQLQGKWYTPVDGRVKIAEHADPAMVRRVDAGYHVTSVQIIQVADRWAYHCMVEYPIGSGVIKPGTDFIDTKDVAGIAKAETSAIGRALGLHGIACEESIASADEVAQFAPEIGEEGDAERPVDSPVKRPPSKPAPVTPIRPKPAQSSPTAETVDELVAVVDPTPKLTPLQQQILDLKQFLELDGNRWENFKKHHTTNEERLAMLQQMADDKRDGYPLDKPARKAAQG